ncbi:hypothetical protein ACG7TL_002105 [Trametes sanguinea]
MDSFRSSSASSGSLPSRSDSVQSKSLHSSSSGSPVSRARPERDYDSVRSAVPSKLLSRLLPKEHQETLSLRTILAVTKDRLESETRRADEAERRVLEVLRKLRTAHEATLLAQSDAARAREELTLYKYRLDDALRELTRAQEIINELEQEKLEAEAEAGYQEGLSRGRDLGYQDALEDDDEEEVDDIDYRKRPVLVEEVDDEEGEIAPSQYRAGTPAPDFGSRTPASDIRIRTPASDTRAPTPGPSGAAYRPPSRLAPSRASAWSHPAVPDAAHFAPTLPVPTLTTPLNLPSPSHSQPETPAPRPKSSPRQVRPEDVPPPIPIQEPIPSPVHPPEAMPPDSWIPYEDPSGEISLPPPHELSRPVTPASMTPMPPPAESQAPPITSDEMRAHPDRFLYAHPSASQSGPVSRSQPNRPFSPQSKASTSISQFELVAPRSKSRAAKAREDYAPARPDDDDEPPVVPPPPDGQFPPGFVPLTPPMRPGSPSGPPLPIPSNNPLPIPPNNPLPVRQNNLMPMRQNSPLPIPQSNALPIPMSNPLPIPPNDPLPIPHHSPRPRSHSPAPPVPTKSPVPIPSNNPTPIPYNGPVPIPHSEPLPVPHRSGTPRSQRYVEAHIPSGVAYPSPPSRRSRTPGSVVSSPPGSRRGVRSPPGERLSPLPLQFFAPLRSDTNTD